MYGKILTEFVSAQQKQLGYNNVVTIKELPSSCGIKCVRKRESIFPFTDYFFFYKIATKEERHTIKHCHSKMKEKLRFFFACWSFTDLLLKQEIKGDYDMYFYCHRNVSSSFSGLISNIK